MRKTHTMRTTIVTDDFDGSTSPDHRTVNFSIEGHAYAIDLSPENAKEFQDAILGPYITAGRRAYRKVAQNGNGAPSRSQRKDTAKIRAWAQAHNMPVASHGRIPFDVRAAYQKANGK